MRRRLEAAIRLLTPDHLTPYAARVLNRILEEEGDDVITVEDYVAYHDYHCPIRAAAGVCACWRPDPPEAADAARLGTTEPGPDPQ